MMMKKGFVFVILSVIFLGLIAGVVSAQATLGETFVDKFIGLFSGNDIDTSKVFNIIQQPGFTRTLVFVLVALVMYSMAGFLPFMEDRRFISFIVSGIIAFLAVFYLTDEQIIATLFSYKALGIVLTGILPFFAIAAISKRSFDRGHVFISKLLWGIFLGVLLALLLNTPLDQPGAKLASLMYGLAGLGALGMFVWEHSVYHLLFKTSRALGHAQMQEGAASLLDVKIAALRAELTEATSADLPQAEIDKIKGQIKKLEKLRKDY